MELGQPFFIFGLPRSRTAWASAFMSYGQWPCHHELEAKCDSLAQFMEVIGGDGNSSTALWRFLPELLERWPNLRYAWLDRASQNIARSCKRKGHAWYDAILCERTRSEAQELGALDQIVLDVEELNHETCLRLWGHLRPKEHFPMKAMNLLRMNVQLTHAEFTNVTTTPVPWLMEAMK